MHRAPTWASFVAATSVDSSLALGTGEREAIVLSLELHADLLLMDDKKARRIAKEHGIRVAGTLGMLKIAHDRGLIGLPEALGQLRRAGFRLSDKLICDILANPIRCASAE